MQTTPSITDTRRQILAKVIAALATLKASPALAPLPTDTRHELLRKWNKLRLL